MIRQTVVDPETGEVLAAVHVAAVLEGEELQAMVAILKAARRVHQMLPEERRAELERLQRAGGERIRERNARLRGEL